MGVSGVFSGCISSKTAKIAQKKDDSGVAIVLLHYAFIRAKISSRLVTLSILNSEVVCIFTVFSER